MIALIQRVSEAAVSVDGEVIGRINRGLLALVAVQPGDDRPRIERMTERLLGYRVFSDANGKMNLSLRDSGGDLLLVSQFTLAADTKAGMRPSFTTAAPPEQARAGFDELVALCQQRLGPDRVACGRFGADMQVSLVNTGPVTFWLES